jgi:tagatose 1,6-diphosphate aldolase
MPKRSLTIGKIRSLQATSNSKGVFTILAFDHRQSYVKMLDPHNPEAISYRDVAESKSQVIGYLAPHSSAVLTDPVYGAAQGIASGALPGNVGLLVSLEETGYTGESTARVTEMIPGWNIDKIKRMGADAVKLLLYYHPGAGELTEQQEELTKRVIAECERADIAFFLEPVSYSIDPQNDKNSAKFAEERPRVIAEIARRLGALGPDVLKLEFPIDANHNMDENQWMEACQVVTEASPCPWALLSAGVNFDLFTKQVEVACKAGASGYIAGRAVWKEGIPMSEDDRKTWLVTVAAKRLDTLQAIAEQHAAPWMDYFELGELEDYDGWYKTYREG